MECTQEMQIKHSEQLARMEEEVRTLRTTLSNFNSFGESLIRLQELNVREVEYNKRQEIAMTQISETLASATTTLRTLNTRVGKLEETDEQAAVRESEASETLRKLDVEKLRSKYILAGVVVAGLLSLAGILIPLFFQGR